MTEWQPIETAPRDGTDVLVATDDHKVFAAHSYGGEWVAQADSAADGIYLSFDVGELTHWMPLPEPPEGS